MMKKNHEIWYERGFLLLCGFSVLLPLAILFYFVAQVVMDGFGRLSLQFLLGFPSRFAEQAGVLPGLVGSFYLLLITGLIALPIGVGAAVYLEEYGKRSRLATLIEVNISNLAGVPSVIYGLLGLAVFVRALGMGRSILAGGCTLAFLVLPIVVISTREALRTVPQGFREASAALGATKWQTIRGVVLPEAMPGILTGAILALSRALGETAPLVVVGALTYVTFLPNSLNSPFTALPLQIYNWVSRPQAAFAANAAAGIVVLLILMLAMNMIAVILRGRMQNRR